MKIKEYLNPAFVIIFFFPFYFTYGLYTGKINFGHDAYTGVYFPFRQWFLDRLLNFEFPLWNPYWGAGHEAVIWSTIPIDLFTPLEMLIRPHYEYFYLVHFMAVALVGYYLFRKWVSNSWVAATASLLFCMSPLIMYWTIQYVNTSSIIAHMFVFYLMIKWFECGNPRYVLLLGWVFFLGMFGTKLEFWFFECIYFGLMSLMAYFIFQPTKLSRVFLVWAALWSAIIAHAWQLNLLVAALGNSKRLSMPHGLHYLFSREFYRNLVLSLGDSNLCSVVLIGILLYMGLNIKSPNRRYALMAGILFSFLLKFWEFSFLHSFVFSSLFVGALIASLMIIRTPSIEQFLTTWVLFLLPAYFWCNKMVDYDETWMLMIAPTVYKGVWGFFVWLGCFNIRRHRIVLLAYLSVLMVLLIENQGQVILAYLFGIIWLKGRDTFLVEFAFVLIAAFGAISYFRFKPLLIRLAPFILVFSSLASESVFYVLHSDPRPPYTGPNLGKGLPYNPFAGVPDLKKTIRDWEYVPYRRVLDPDIDNTVNVGPLNIGTFMLERTNHATLYASMKPARYQELIDFYGHGIKPEDHIAGYPSVFSEKTISRLPKTNTKGLSNGLIYYLTQWSIPSLDLGLLRLLGVDHIVTRGDMLSNPGLIQQLKLTDYKKSVEFKSARLADTLPRTFVVSNVTSERLKDFQENMRPQIELAESKGLASSYTAKPARFIKYEPEYVAIGAMSEGGYLVLTDVFHPYWKARVDGQPAEIIPAFHAFRAVKVPPGAHTIEFFCSVPKFKLAFIVSFMTVILGLIGTFFVFRGRADFPTNA